MSQPWPPADPASGPAGSPPPGGYPPAEGYPPADQPGGYPAQPYPVSPPYPDQPYPAEPYPAQAYPAPPYPGPSYPGSPYPGPPYPGSPYPGPPYPGPPYYGFPPGIPTADPGAPYGRDPMTGEPLSDKSKVTAGLLQLFLGGFGVGRFYIGSTGVAIAQLFIWIVGLLLMPLYLLGLVVWLGLGIWVLVDAIRMFTGSVRDQHGRPLNT